MDGGKKRKSSEAPRAREPKTKMDSAYIFVAATIVLGVYGQLILKWQTGKLGSFPDSTAARFTYMRHFLLNGWVISSLIGAAVAALAWIAALSHLELSRAYPFVSASFVLVLLLSAVIFKESLTPLKLVGALLIVSGLIIGTQG
jgi:multidrug transporter EmrE-like cation transporter